MCEGLWSPNSKTLLIKIPNNGTKEHEETNMAVPSLLHNFITVDRGNNKYNPGMNYEI